MYSLCVCAKCTVVYRRARTKQCQMNLDNSTAGNGTMRMSSRGMTKNERYSIPSKPLVIQLPTGALQTSLMSPVPNTDSQSRLRSRDAHHSNDTICTPPDPSVFQLVWFAVSNAAILWFHMYMKRWLLKYACEMRPIVRLACIGRPGGPPRARVQ